MAAGLGLGRLIPSLNDGLSKLQVGTVSLPIALGLLLMMYPVLAKVRYEELGHSKHDGVSNRPFFGVSLFLSWVSDRCSCSRSPGSSSPTSPPTAPA